MMIVPGLHRHPRLGQNCPPGTVLTTGQSPDGQVAWVRCEPAAGATQGGGGTTAGGAGGALPGPGPGPVPGAGPITVVQPPAGSGFPSTALPPFPPGMAPVPTMPGPVPGIPPMTTVPPGTILPPRGAVDPAMAERLLSQADDAWASTELAILRGRRCGASEAEKEAAMRASECISIFTRSAGSLSAAMAELCAAKSQGRDARLTATQVAALEAIAACLSEGVPAAPTESPGWLRAVVGTAVPAAAAVLIAV